MNYPLITKISEISNEAKNTKTIKFEYNEKITPGQFFMIWIPNIDEIPMSVSYISNKEKGITFRNVGDATKALSNLKKGNKIGIRGPYGKGFKLEGKKTLFAGGGTGIATLTPSIEEAVKNKIDTTVILGFKTKDEVFFEERIKKTGAKLYVCTDDGSKGYYGFATDLANELTDKNNFDSVITCGPEIMMKKLYDTSKNINFQASLERYMKCGFGLCGQCCVGDGKRVCVEGPVFDGKTLKNIKDFGIFKRDAAGKKIKI